MNEPHMAPWWFPANDHPLDKARHRRAHHRAAAAPRGRPTGCPAAARRTAAWPPGTGGRPTRWRPTWRSSPPVTSRSRAAAATGCPGWSPSHGSWPATASGWRLRLAAQDPADHGVAGGRARRLPVRRAPAGWSPASARASPWRTRPGRPTPSSAARRPGCSSTSWPTSGSATRCRCRRWRDIWLNEGSATYMEARYAEAHGGPGTAAWLRRAYGEFGADEWFWRVPVADPGPDRIFDGAVYDRGAMTLAALRDGGRRRDFADAAADLGGASAGRQRHHRGLRGAGRGGQRPRPRRVLRRLARGAGQAGRHRGQRPRLNGSRASRRRSGAIARATRLGRRVSRSSASATVIARSPALMPSQRSGSGSQRRERCPTHGSRTSVGVAAEHQVAQGAAGEVGGADAVADVPAGPAQPGPAVEPDRRAPVAGDAQRAAPRVGDPGAGERREQVHQRLAAAARRPGRRGRTRAGSASRSGTARPRPPKTSRSSAVRWP